MIQEFSIENTFSIKTRQTISFEAADDTDEMHCIKVGGKKLLKLAAIYGANASGKSNVIRAFDFYMDFILNSFTSLKPQAPIPFTPFLFDEKNANAAGSFEIVFYMDEIKFTYMISLDSRFVHSESLLCEQGEKVALIFDRSADLNNIGNTKVDYEWGLGESLSDNVEEIIQKTTRANATFLSTAAQLNDQQLGKIYSYLADIMLPTINPATRSFLDIADTVEKNESLKKVVLAMLEKADFSNINDIIVERDEIKDISIAGRHFNPAGPLTRIYFSHHYDKDVILPLSNESQGTQRILTLAAPLLKLLFGNKILFIDEIETSLHNDLLEFFITTFLNNSEKSQLLFTTHNQDLLDSDLLLDDEIWFVEKDKTGGSEIYSLIEFQDIPPNVSRRGLYKAGNFGAKPFIISYFKD